MGNYLIANVTGEDLIREAPRVGFERGLQRAAAFNERVVVLCADAAEPGMMQDFATAFPERLFTFGAAAQTMVTVGAGLAVMKYIPFAVSDTSCMPASCWERIRSMICLHSWPVKLVGFYRGVNVDSGDLAQSMFEDIALLRTLPTMVIIAPCDSIEAEKATLAMARDPRPNYLRLSQDAAAIITTPDAPFQIGTAYVLDSGEDITIISTGTMTYQALLAATELYKQGIDVEVVHVPTIKPLDEQTILKSVRKTKRAITIEEANASGGLGSAVAELLSEFCPVPLRRLGIPDGFSTPHEARELLRHGGLNAQHIVAVAQMMIPKPVMK